MAWNEPGNGKDPWTNRGGKDGPPDLDEVVRKLQNKLGALFRGGSGGGDNQSAITLTFIIVLVTGIWLLSGIYTVNQVERGVVLRFGKYHETALPGLHWRIPWPVDTVEKVNVTQVESWPHRTQMLTRDENLVVIEMTVQYRRSNPENFLFNVRTPEISLREVGESAIREVIGKSTLDDVLTGGREQITSATRSLIQDTLNQYESGIEVRSVNLQLVQLPDPVKPAADDVNKAREDKERVINEAQTYANDIVPKARGQAARRLQEAEAYRERVIAEAEGATRRFSQLLTQYKAAPRVTRERLYLETIEEVLGRNSKIFLDAEGSGNLLYLPIDRLMEQRRSDRLTNSVGAGSDSFSNEGLPAGGDRDRDSQRSRRNR